MKKHIILLLCMTLGLPSRAQTGYYYHSRLFIIPLLLIMAIGFVGCNGHDDDNNEVSCIPLWRICHHER